MARVAIVIPAYNAARLITATLQSIVRSTHGDFEVMVIDDGSTDDTAAAASGLDKRIKVVSRPNAGMSASRNLGVASTDSEFVAFLDADDIWHPEKLRLQLAALDERPDYDFCFTDFTWWWGDERPGFFSEPRTGNIDPQLTGWIYHELILDNLTLPSSVLLRRSAWKELGPFCCDNQKTDDWEFLVRASHQFRFVRLAESFVLYRQIASSLSKRIPPVNYHEEMRTQLLQRFGMQSRDGTPIDPGRLADFQYRGQRVFADQHCASGQLGLGLKAFGKLLLDGPKRGETVSSLGKSIYRRAFPRRA